MRGWIQVAFERDLNDDITPIMIDDEPFVVVRQANRWAVYDATCPHRGMDLGYGGVLVGDAIRCPFHHFLIHLGEKATGLCVRDFESLAVGGLVFALDDAGGGRGLSELLTTLDKDHYFVPGFTMVIAAPAALVTENAFDGSHFRPVHGVLRDPEIRAGRDECGAFVGEGVFELPPSRWQRTLSGQSAIVPFRAYAFSPYVVATSMLGEHPYWVITAATPIAGGSIVRLTVVLPAPTDGRVPMDEARYLIDQSRSGLEKDRMIWERMKSASHPSFTAADQPVREFQEFCREFRLDA